MFKKLKYLIVNNKYKKVLLVLLPLIIVLFLTLILTSKAFMKPILANPAITSVSISTCGTMTLTDQNPITLANAYPMSDNKGLLSTPYTFTITNSCNEASSFMIYLVVFNDSEIPNNNIKYNLDTTNNTALISSLPERIFSTAIKNQLITKIGKSTISNVYQLDSKSLSAGSSQTFNLRMWLDINAGNELMNKSFISTVAIADATTSSNASLTKLTITGAKTSYKVGDTISNNDFTATATYSDNTTVDVTQSVSISNTNALTSSDTSYTISYTNNGIEKTATQNISVVSLSNLSISPLKTTYTIGDIINRTDFIATATYSDNSTENVTQSVSISNTNALTLSDTSYIISYINNGITKTATQNISVNNILNYVGGSDTNWTTYCSNNTYYSLDNGSTWNSIVFSTSGTTSVNPNAKIKQLSSDSNYCRISFCTTNSCTASSTPYALGTSTIMTLTSSYTYYYLSYSTCFTEDTLIDILDKNGKKKKKKIKDIKSNDIVLTFDEDTGKIIPKKVAKIIKTKIVKIYNITLSNDEIIKCSGGHPFYVKGISWLPAEHLKTGFELMSSNGKYYKITNIFITNHEEDSYNIQFETNGNYFVGKSCILVLAVIIMSQEEFINRKDNVISNVISPLQVWAS
jgi:hypothetical protein